MLGVFLFDAFRFTYFSRASLDYIAKSGKQPDVLHIHNWETAIVGPLFWDIFVKQVQLDLLSFQLNELFDLMCRCLPHDLSFLHLSFYLYIHERKQNMLKIQSF